MDFQDIGAYKNLHQVSIDLFKNGLNGPLYSKSSQFMRDIVLKRLMEDFYKSQFLESLARIQFGMPHVGNIHPTDNPLIT